MPINSDDVLLVTGGNGYIASWIILLALERGIKVRATVRSTQPSKVKHLTSLPRAKELLEIVELDLLKGTAADFCRVVKGCTLVAHTASPFLLNVKNEEEDLIKPAVEGTLGVLRAVADADAGKGVRAVVVTASVASVASGYSHAEEDAHGPFGEKDFSKAETAPAYPRSKTLAEKAAWEFYEKLGPNPAFSLTTIHPSFVQGPALTPEKGTSMNVISMMMNREAPLCPQIGFDVVDVRDVALAHLRVFDCERAEVNKRRFLITNHRMMFLEIATILAEEFNKYGVHPPTTNMPKFVAILGSFIIPELRATLGNWGRGSVVFDNQPSKDVLKIEYHDFKETIKLSGHSAMIHGLVKKHSKDYKPAWEPPKA